MKSQAPLGSWVKGDSSSQNDSALASTGHMIPSFSVTATDTAHLLSVTCKCPNSWCHWNLNSSFRIRFAAGPLLQSLSPSVVGGRLLAWMGPQAPVLPLSSHSLHDFGKSLSLSSQLLPHRNLWGVALGMHVQKQSFSFPLWRSHHIWAPLQLVSKYFLCIDSLCKTYQLMSFDHFCKWCIICYKWTLKSAIKRVNVHSHAT